MREAFSVVVSKSEASQIASAEAGGVRLCLQLLQPPATVRTAALELLQELLGGLLCAPVYQAFALVRVRFMFGFIMGQGGRSNTRGVYSDVVKHIWERHSPGYTHVHF